MLQKISNCFPEIIIAQSPIMAQSPLVAQGSGALEKNKNPGLLLEKIRDMDKSKSNSLLSRIYYNKSSIFRIQMYTVTFVPVAQGMVA